MSVFNPKQLRTLLKQDYWTKPELEWILFGPQHPFLQESGTSHSDKSEPNFKYLGLLRSKVPTLLLVEARLTLAKYRLIEVFYHSPLREKIQDILDEDIGGYIDGAVSTKKLNKSPEKIRRKLFLNTPPIVLPIDHYGYETLGLLRLLFEKEYTISKVITS